MVFKEGAQKGSILSIRKFLNNIQTLGKFKSSSKPFKGAQKSSILTKYSKKSQRKFNK